MPVARYALNLYGEDLPPISLAASVTYTESLSQTVQLANGASDTQLAFGGVTTADIVYIYSDQQITINVNSSSGTDITVDAKKPFFQAGTAVTGLWASNSSGSTANIRYVVIGA